MYGFFFYIFLDTLGHLWEHFQNIIGAINNAEIIYQLDRYNVLNPEEIKVINTTVNKNVIPMLITKMVSASINNGDLKHFSRFASFMEIHWALKFLILYWRKTSKI